MLCIHEFLNGSIAPGADETVDIGLININFDALDYQSVTYWVNCPDYHTLSLQVLSSPWQVDIPLSSADTSGEVSIPVGISCNSISVSLANNSGITVNDVNFAVGLSKSISGAAGDATMARDVIYTKSINDEYPISVRSTNDASLLVGSVIPNHVDTLDGFSTVASVNVNNFRSFDNIPLVTEGMTLRLPAVLPNQHCIATTELTAATSKNAEYIIDVETADGCQVKYGSLSFNISDTSVMLNLLRPQAYHMFRVTSSSGVGGTLSLTIYGVTITGAVMAASTRTIQATNIANVINNNPLALARAVAVGDRVYVRTLMNQITGTNTVNNLYTVVSTVILNNSSFAEETVLLSSRIIASRNDPITVHRRIGYGYGVGRYHATACRSWIIRDGRLLVVTR